MTRVREILAGRYELLDPLGRGGMGVVYRAHDQVLGRTVAIKVLPVDRAADPQFVARFEREALAAAGLNHPNIVAIYDSARDGETRFIVMECVAGSSLSDLLADQGRLPAEQAVQIGAQIADALAAAHQAGIVHRDVNPANVMVDDQGRVKVLDFGIARAAAYATLTQTDVIMGSASYLAPELARGASADERSDIYALGCVMYAMLTGDPPFSGELPAVIMHQQLTAPPRPPRELNPAIPTGLEALLLRMLAKGPAERPQRAAQLVSALPDSLGADTAATSPLASILPVPDAAPTGPTRVLGPAPTEPLPLGTTPTDPLSLGPAPTEPLPRRDPQPRSLSLGQAGAAGRQRWERSLAPVALVLAIVVIAAIAAAAGSGSGPRKVASRHPFAGAGAGPHRSVAQTRARTQAKALNQTTSHAPPSQPGTTPASASSQPGAAVSALTRLVASDVQAGTVDQPAAEQILSALRDGAAAYTGGQVDQALRSIGRLPSRIERLVGQGDIQPSAAGGLDAAVNQLQSSLARTPLALGSGSGGPAPDSHGHGNGNGSGDGQGGGGQGGD